MTESISLSFDNRTAYGSKEHFFHFLWGYLLPAVYQIKAQEKQRVNQQLYCFETCGPVMDCLSQEVINQLALPAEIAHSSHSGKFSKLITVPRWDLYLLRDLILGIEPDSSSRIANFQKSIYLTEILSAADFTVNFLKQIQQIRSLFLDQIDDDPSSDISNRTAPILVLQRSAMPHFYTQKGGAEISGYGLSRRALVGIGEFVKTFGSNKNIQAYEPGKSTFFEQISRLYASRGIIGIKGAEFANLLWLRPGSKVILIRPEQMKTPPVQHKLANLLDLDFQEITCGNGNYPDLMELNLQHYL